MEKLIFYPILGLPEVQRMNEDQLWELRLGLLLLLLLLFSEKI